MTKKKRILVQEVPPGVEIFTENAEGLAHGGVVKPDPVLVGERIHEQTITREEAFDLMIEHEIKKAAPVKPRSMTKPLDLGKQLLPRLAGLRATPGSMSEYSFPEEPLPAELERDYPVTVTLQAHTQADLAPLVDAAIQAGKEELRAGPVTLYLHAVQGWDKITGPGSYSHPMPEPRRPDDHDHSLDLSNFYSVELKYIYRIRPSQEV